MEKIELRQAGVDDVPLIARVAEETWGPTYLPFIPKGQVDFMFGEMYTPEALVKQLNALKHTFLLLISDNSPAAFASFSRRPESPDIFKLHKLYISPAHQKKGFGRMLLAAVEKWIINEGSHILELNVNRKNPAFGFYTQMGFFIAREEDIPIGAYWMNDYVMRKELA